MLFSHSGFEVIVPIISAKKDRANDREGYVMKAFRKCMKEIEVGKERFIEKQSSNRDIGTDMKN